MTNTAGAMDFRVSADPGAVPSLPAPSTAGYAAGHWTALGTYVDLVVARPSRLARARAACERLLAVVDASCSRFRADSDLSRANRQAGSWVPVDRMLITALTAAIGVAEDTGGLVVPTLGRNLVALGYDRDLAQVGARAQESTPRGPDPAPDAWKQILVDPEGRIRVPAGIALDLGSTGKAFAADLIAATVPALTGTALVVSLGGDVAVGHLPDQPRTLHPWRVAVAEHPDELRLPSTETVLLEEGAIATSSTRARTWRRAGERMHHLLDPRTGRPVQGGWRTVSVCAPTCLEANAASTAAVVMGDAAVGWLEHRDLAARLVRAEDREDTEDGGEDGGEVVRVAGWPWPDGEDAR